MEQAFFPSLQGHISLQPTTKQVNLWLPVPYFEGHVDGPSDHKTQGNFI
jgi:hypothetical protein